MKEYIERNETIAALTEFCYDQTVSKYLSHEHCLVARDAIERSTNVLESLPAADVVPVRHGRWIEPARLYYGAKQYECSLCYSDTFWKKHEITEKYPCCPNCGAKMDGGTN